MPWHNLHVATDGTIAPCCEYDGAVGRLDSQTLDDAWNGEQLATIRRQFATGEDVEGCWKCFEREAAGATSLRLQKNRVNPAWMAKL
jgi:radical SAM protein with 4Fe4S-binding SPASM domain